ncbi:hypothetical protein L218DRAFT_994100 [Marasmius fiardii PR-910]|nr:hypothetical protein L218DRAFT_994100 [Marasmius fiardii PR-910]
MGTTYDSLPENLTFHASAIARRTRTRTQTGPAASLHVSTGRTTILDSPVIPKLAKRGSELQRSPPSTRQRILSNNRLPPKNFLRSKQGPAANDFLEIPDPLVLSALKTRFATKEKIPDRFKGKETGDNLRKEDGVKEKGIKAQEISISQPSTPRRTPSSFGSDQIPSVGVKPLKIAKWTGSSLQAGLSSEISTYLASSAKSMALSERDTNVALPNSTRAANILLESNKQQSRSSMPTPTSPVRDAASAHVVSSRVSPHQKSSSLGGLLNRRTFWSREVTDLTSVKRRNRHATTCSLDATSTTAAAERFKRHAIYSPVGPPPVPPTLIPRVGDTDSLDSIVRAYHSSIVCPLTIETSALTTSPTRTSTKTGIVYHPTVRELLKEVDEALQSWNRAE